MPHNRTYAEPSEVSVNDCEVVVNGPGGVAVTLTPEAAVETSNRLLEAGVEALGRKLMKRR